MTEKKKPVLHATTFFLILLWRPTFRSFQNFVRRRQKKLICRLSTTSSVYFSEVARAQGAWKYCIEVQNFMWVYERDRSVMRAWYTHERKEGKCFARMGVTLLETFFQLWCLLFFPVSDDLGATKKKWHNTFPLRALEEWNSSSHLARSDARKVHCSRLKDCVSKT